MFTLVQTRGGTANVEVIQSSLENLESDSNAAHVRGGRAPEKVVRGVIVTAASQTCRL
jgi:hypothetical protein